MAVRRVVVTGTGVLACNGTDSGSFWSALIAGRHGIGPITAFDADGPATVYVDGKEYHTVVITSKNDPGSTTYTLKASDDLMQVSGSLDASSSTRWRHG